MLFDLGSRWSPLAPRKSCPWEEELGWGGGSDPTWLFSQTLVLKFHFQTSLTCKAVDNSSETKGTKQILTIPVFWKFLLPSTMSANSGGLKRVALHLICEAKRTGFHNICKQPYKLNNSTSPQSVTFSVETPLHTLASGERGRIKEGIFVRIKCKIPFVIKCYF